MLQIILHAAMAQSVERRLGKAEVGGSSPLGSFHVTVQPSDKELSYIAREETFDAVYDSSLLFGALRERDGVAKLRNRAWLNCYVKVFCVLQEREEAT